MCCDRVSHFISQRKGAYHDSCYELAQLATVLARYKNDGTWYLAGSLLIRMKCSRNRKGIKAPFNPWQDEVYSQQFCVDQVRPLVIMQISISICFCGRMDGCACFSNLAAWNWGIVNMWYEVVGSTTTALYVRTRLHWILRSGSAKPTHHNIYLFCFWLEQSLVKDEGLFYW